MKNKATFLSLVFLFSLLFQVNIVAAQQSLEEKITGFWQGEGTLMGAPAQFAMRWEKVLGEQFLKLTFQSKRIIEGNQTSKFSAIAFYKIRNDSLWQGTWFDVRGISFPVNGTSNGSSLTVEWGSPEIEQGRTVYKLEDKNSMIVTDYINKNGNYSKFGEASYERIPNKEK